MGRGDDFSFFRLSGRLPGTVLRIGRSGMRPDAVESSAAAPKGGTAAPAHGETGALMVLNTHSARLAGRTLWLEGVEASAIVVADRPIRRAGYVSTPWTAGS